MLFSRSLVSDLTVHSPHMCKESTGELSVLEVGLHRSRREFRQYIFVQTFIFCQMISNVFGIPIYTIKKLFDF